MRGLHSQIFFFSRKITYRLIKFASNFTFGAERIVVSRVINRCLSSVLAGVLLKWKKFLALQKVEKNFQFGFDFSRRSWNSNPRETVPFGLFLNVMAAESIEKWRNNEVKQEKNASSIRFYDYPYHTSFSVLLKFFSSLDWSKKNCF